MRTVIWYNTDSEFDSVSDWIVSYHIHDIKSIGYLTKDLFKIIKLKNGDDIVFAKIGIFVCGFRSSHNYLINPTDNNYEFVKCVIEPMLISDEFDNSGIYTIDRIDNYESFVNQYKTRIDYYGHKNG